jgi:hypothetical protein
LPAEQDDSDLGVVNVRRNPPPVHRGDPDSSQT